MTDQKIVKGETGTTVLPNIDNGVFPECQSRTHICGYACCKFGKLGNWIFALPGEVTLAKEQGLSFEHLTVEEIGEGHKITCNRPCVVGEFKSIDCAIYPLFPANLEVTRFIVADHRKCPIPNLELLGHIFKVRKICLDWEKNYPGTIKSMIDAGKDFTAYQAFPFELSIIKGEGADIDLIKLKKLTKQELDEIRPYTVLSDQYKAEYNISLDLLHKYTSSSTPEDSIS